MTAHNEDVILQRIQLMLGERFALSDVQLKSSQSLSDLGIDSLAMTEFMFDLEMVFDISLPKNSASIQTIEDIAALVRVALDRNITLK